MQLLEDDEEESETESWADEDSDGTSSDDNKGVVMVKQKKSLTCYYCQGKHGLFKCVDFLNVLNA